MRGLCAIAFGLAVAATVISGCRSSGREVTNFSHITFQGDPAIQSQADPTARVRGFRTFAVVQSGRSNDPISERRLAWAVDWFLLQQGGVSVDNPVEADAIVLLGFTNEYKEVYVPPKSVIIPWQEKGDTTYWTGTIGSSSGTSTVSGSTSTPGRTTWKTVQRPGRVEGAFYPTVAMLTADGAMARSQPENVAAALVSTEAIVQASKIGNGLLTGQMLLVRLLEQSSRLDRSLARQPFPGVIWGMLSSDGVDTYPTVVVIDEASPWAVAGLRRWDMILDVNSEDAANMLWPDFRSALGTETGKLKRLRVRRPDGEISIDLTLSGDTGLPRRPEASRGGD